MTACLLVLAVIVGLSARHGVTSPQAGIELGAPANPVDDPGTARPEWSFRGLYELHELLRVRGPKMISILIIPGLAVTLLFFAIPLVGQNIAGRVLNIALVLFIFGGVAVLAWQSYSEDAKNPKYQAALQAGREQAERVKELADSPQKIPVSGALTLLQTDAKTQGPILFNQYCASCHDFSGPDSGITRPAKPTAADLYGFASRAWLTEFMTAKGISRAQLSSATREIPSKRKCTSFSRTPLPDFKVEEQQQIIAAAF